MTNKDRKQRSDSIAGQLQATRSAAAPEKGCPELPGIELLGTYGRESLERLYNVRPDGWSQADLLLLVDLAVTEEQLRTQRMVAQMVPTVVTLSNGVTARHPIHAVVADLQKQKRDLCRDLGIRSKDGAPAALAHTTPATEATPATDRSGGFEAWLDAQMESHGGH